MKQRIRFTQRVSAFLTTMVMLLGATTAFPMQKGYAADTVVVYQPLHQIKHVLASKHWKLKVSSDESSSWKCKCILARKS